MSSEQTQATLASDGTPLGECRVQEFGYFGHENPVDTTEIELAHILNGTVDPATTPPERSEMSEM